MLLVWIAGLADASLQGDTSSLLNYVGRLVSSEVKIGLLGEGDLVTDRVGLCTDRA